jgi:DNA helicase-2/ATP-dependent DNA helicase PcrA
MQNVESKEPVVDVPIYMNDLNQPQKEAVETIDGPVLMLAGAGTGKTRALTTRLAHLLYTNKAFPGEILAVTFTNKAAQEMKERVSSLLGGQTVEGWWLGTFHSLAARMLRSHADIVGLSSNFTIIDPDDQVRLIKQIMELENIDSKKWSPKAVIDQIDRWKDKGKTPSRLDANDAGDAADGKLLLLYKRYQERLKTVNACDFGDLLLHMITILSDPKNSEILADYNRRFRYILVDEYQDTNVAQYMWLRLLSKGSDNICCVGDDDQSIYGWRGAEVGNILRFEKDYPDAKVIRLEQNYRSTANILAAAGGIISYNEGRLDKTLWCDADEGNKVAVRGLWDGDAEARWLGEEVETLHSRGEYSLNQIAILVRTSFQMRAFEERFIQLGIPYRVIGGPRFYERKEIRDALAYLRVLSQKADDLALERIINVPSRKIGNVTVQTLYVYARSKGLCLYEAITALCDTDELRPKVKETLLAFIEDFERWRSLIDTVHHAELAGMVLEESGYISMWREDKSPDAPGRVENLKELVSAMEGYDSMQEFLEHVALVLENQDTAESDCVSIMTLHGAKGLEFDVVFLPGWEEALFPSQRTIDENGIRGLEEERRLAYVGLTRARKKAYISYAANRLMYGKWLSAIPSRFIDELPSDNIEVISDNGLSSGGRSSHWDSSGITPSLGQRRAVTSNERKTVNDHGDVFAMGIRVAHDKFGCGTVINVDGHKLDIKFDNCGHKRVMDSFVEVVSD